MIQQTLKENWHFEYDSYFMNSEIFSKNATVDQMNETSKKYTIFNDFINFLKKIIFCRKAKCI